MPTYDYICRACGHEFELFQQMSEPVKRKCPRCGKAKLERLIGAGAGVLFKGGGFYETDYRSDSYKKAAEAENKPAASESKSETKADSKPETEKASESSSSEAKAASGAESKPKPERKPKKSGRTK